MNHLLIGKKLFDKTMTLVQRSMDIRASRHRILSSNVANIETPEYVSRDLPFQKVFEHCLEDSSALSMRKTHPAHLPAAEGPLSQDFTSPIETDPGSGGVDIDQQMSRLAENNLMFQAGVQALIKKFEALKVGISESR
jgi:flagellar basal-body rod protein FlgB